MGKRKDEINCYDTVEQIKACLKCKKAECTDCIFAQKHYDAERKRLEKRKLKKAADKAGKQQI